MSTDLLPVSVLGAGRVGANLARGINCALLLDRAHKIGNRQPKFGEQIRFNPDAHRVIAGAEKANLTHARNTIECIVDVDVRVVRQEK